MDSCEKEKACINEAVRRIDNFLIIVIVCAISFVLGIWAGISYEQHRASTPIERNNVIDSLIAVNDTIKIKVEKLDSIKNAKVIEVSTLDNDSTLKLFQELVSE